MKNKSIILIFVMMLLTVSCHKPDELLPPISRLGINSITATFSDGTGNFVGLVQESSNIIRIQIPYFYPEDSDYQITYDSIKKMRVKANLDDNVIIEPPLLYMDLSKDNSITVIDQKKQRKEYIVRGEILKSDKASIEAFSLPDYKIDGIVSENEGVIYLVTLDELITPVIAEVKISSHSTISPDPRLTLLSYESEQKLTVTAHDGVTSKSYTVKKSIPEKTPFGIRLESAKLLFSKKLKDDLGIADGLSTGIALSGNYLAINSRGNNTIYIDAKTGEKKGEFDLNTLKGANLNYYHTSDDAGNILICNYVTAPGEIFRISKMTSVNSTPETLLEWIPDNGERLTKKFSVVGDVNTDAIITVPLNPGSFDKKFVRWQIKDGLLTSTSPEVITVSVTVGGHLSNPFTAPQLGRGWRDQVDIVHTSATDINADYYIIYYGDDIISLFDGLTHKQKKFIHLGRTAFIGNALDIITFNGAKYLSANFVNGGTAGTGDVVWLLDVSTQDFNNGNLNAATSNAIVFEGPRKIYGPVGIEAPANTTYGADVKLASSIDGYYLYMYFMFNNGCVVGYQFDCVKN